MYLDSYLRGIVYRREKTEDQRGLETDGLQEENALERVYLFSNQGIYLAYNHNHSFNHSIYKPSSNLLLQW